MTLQLADLLPGQPDAKRALTGAAGLLAAVSGASPGSAMAELVTVTTTQQYSGTASPQGTTASFDVLFTPVQNATDLVSISAGSVYTGESASLTIQAIASDDSPLTLFGPYFINNFFRRCRSPPSRTTRSRTSRRRTSRDCDSRSKISPGSRRPAFRRSRSPWARSSSLWRCPNPRRQCCWAAAWLRC